MPEPEGKKPDAARRTDINPFIGKVAPDPAHPQPLMRLTGYRGASSEAGHTRLYLDANISGYVDIPDADIVHELPVPHEVDPLGAVSLWVKQNSKLNFQASKSVGGDPSMFGQYGMPGGQAAAPQNVGATGFPTQPTFTQPTVTQTFTQPTVTQTFTPPPSFFQTFCPPSIHPFCPPSPPVFCPPSPHIFCPPPSPQPIFCTHPSPLILHCTVSPLPHLCPPSPQPIQCTQPSPLIIQCGHSPFVVCNTTIPVSPTCTPGSPQTFSPATPGGSPATTAVGSGAGVEAAAFGAAPQAGTAPTQTGLQSFFIACPPPPSQQFVCPPPHTVLCQSVFAPCLTLHPVVCPSIVVCPPSPHLHFCPPHTPFCPSVLIQCPSPLPLCHTVSPVTPASPNCTPTPHTTIPTATQTSPATTQVGGGMAAAQQPQQQAFTFTPLTIPTFPTHPTIATHPTFPTQPTFPTHPTFPTIPTWPTFPTRPTFPTITIQTVTQTSFPTFGGGF